MKTPNTEYVWGRQSPRVLAPSDLFPPKGHRYLTDERLEELRLLALSAGDGTVTMTAYSVMELISDWRNMAAHIDGSGADQ